jgi:hypothetical protein
MRTMINAIREVYDQTRRTGAPHRDQGTQGRVPGTTFRDCPDCSEMVVVSVGRITSRHDLAFTQSETED